MPAEHRPEDGWKVWDGAVEGLVHRHRVSSGTVAHSHPLGDIKHDHAPGDEAAITSQRDWILTDRVSVARADLEYLLAHYWDEIHGSPDASRWRQPLLRQAVTRLAGSLTDPS